MEKYRDRIADKLLECRLEEVGAVLVEGPKWCGKTTTCEQHAKSIIYMDDPAMKDQYRIMAQTQVQALLPGDTPHLIDEWQVAPQLWDAIRFEVDHRPVQEGQFILTGSAVPVDTSQIEHSGIGRFARLKMRTMSLFESGESSGEVSLEKLFSSQELVNGRNDLQLQDIAYLVCRGGWPSVLNKSQRASLRVASDYYEMLVESDISRVDGVDRNPEWADKLMKSYARLQGSQASANVIAQDIQSLSAETISSKTIENYLNALRKIFVVDDMKAWNPRLRSKTAVRTSSTRYLTDPSMAAAALGIGPQDLMNDLNTFGLLFETLCVRDLRIYADCIDGTVYHYRDKDELECDAVVHLRNGKYGLIEIKLGGDQAISEAASNLKKLAAKIDTTALKQPSFMMVLTAVGKFAYTRQDGVCVVPIACFKP